MVQPRVGGERRTATEQIAPGLAVNLYHRDCERRITERTRRRRPALYLYRHTQQLLAREQRAAPFAASALDAVQLRMTAAVDRVFLARPLRSDAHQRAVSARGDAVDERRDLAV